MIHRAARSIFLAGVLSSAVAVPVDVKLATLVAKVESMSSKNATATNMVQETQGAPKKIVEVYAEKLSWSARDTAGSCSNELHNLQSIVTYLIGNSPMDLAGESRDWSNMELGSSITSFGDPDLATKLAAASFFFMTDMETKFPDGWDSTSQAALANFVSNGGTMLMTGTAGTRDTDFLNAAFGWDTSTTSCRSSSLNTANAAGTVFEHARTTVDCPSATDRINCGSTECKPIYDTASAASVSYFAHGRGTVLYVGYDYYNTGYRVAIPSGMHSDCSARSNSWVTDVLPLALLAAEEAAVEAAEEAAEEAAPAVPDLPPRVGTKCSGYGDPHIDSFSGERFNVFGLGVFPFATLSDYEVQVFNCPPSAEGRLRAGASMIAGVAVKVGSDLVSMIGDEIQGNGAAVPPGWVRGGNAVGALKVDYHPFTNGRGHHVRVTAPSGAKVGVTRINDVNAAPGYTQNVHAKLPLSLGTNTGMSFCSASTGTTIDAPEASKNLFTASQMAALEASCGSNLDASVTAGEEPQPAAVCATMGQDVTVAKSVCESGCTCGTEEGVKDCMFDYCMLGADSEAATTCADEFPCPSTADDSADDTGIDTSLD